MHKTSYRLPQLALLALAAAWLGGLATPAKAGPIVSQEAKQQGDAAADTSKLVPLVTQDSDVDDITNWDQPASPPGTSKAAAKPGAAASSATAVQANPTTNPRPNSAPAPSAAASQPSLGKDLHDGIKEAVRPVYDGLIESGALDTLHDVKEGLGLNKNQWSDPNTAQEQPKASGQWGTPDVTMPPRTEAQAQMDRELAGMMRTKLIDQLTPWAIGLAALLLAGYLIKLLLSFIHWKSARRNERIIQQARRQAARRSHHSGARTVPSPLGPRTAPPVDRAISESEETM